MRLTKGRVVLRVLVLASAGGFMLWRASERLGAGRALGADGLTLRRLALFEAVLGILALALAVYVAFALRPRARRRRLGLGDRSAPSPRR